MDLTVGQNIRKSLVAGLGHYQRKLAKSMLNVHEQEEVKDYIDHILRYEKTI